MIGLYHVISLPFSMRLNLENIILRMGHSAILFSQNLVRMYVRLYLLIAILQVSLLFNQLKHLMDHKLVLFQEVQSLLIF